MRNAESPIQTLDAAHRSFLLKLWVEFIPAVGVGGCDGKGAGMPVILQKVYTRRKAIVNRV